MNDLEPCSRPSRVSARALSMACRRGRRPKVQTPASARRSVRTRSTGTATRGTAEWAHGTRVPGCALADGLFQACSSTKPACTAAAHRSGDDAAGEGTDHRALGTALVQVTMGEGPRRRTRTVAGDVGGIADPEVCPALARGTGGSAPVRADMALSYVRVSSSCGCGSPRIAP